LCGSSLLILVFPSKALRSGFSSGQHRPPEGIF
jgi:hypothetical protein